MKEFETVEEFEAIAPTPKAESTGKKFLTMRWVDTKEKSRVVCREFAIGARDDLFAAASTPTTHLIIDALACIHRWSRAIGDISRAFLHVPEDEEVFAEPPAEWTERERQKTEEAGEIWVSLVWRLLKVFYGRRKAAKMWVDWLAAILVKRCGLERSTSAPQFFVLRVGDRTAAVIEVHMDDLHCGGHREVLQKIGGEIAKDLKIKNWKVYVFGEPCFYTHLRRERRSAAEACHIKPNPVHIKRCAELLGLEQAKAADTPLASGDRGEESEDTQHVTNAEAVLYRRIVCILLHVVIDRANTRIFN